MTILTCRPTQQRHVDKYTTLIHMKEYHPQIYEIIQQVKNSPLIIKKDKVMIEQELICMATTLNEAKEYSLVIGLWSGKAGEVTYSKERKRAVECERIIMDETIFTITSYSRKKVWTAYIDLPIDIKL